MKSGLKILFLLSLALNIVFIYRRISRQRQIAFVGDSITEALPSERISSASANWGVSGYTTYDVTKLIGKVGRSNPERIYLQIGINDLSANISVDSAFKNFQTVTEILTREHPEIKLFVSSLFPTSQSYENLNPQVVAFNSKIQSFCRRKGITYINMYPSLYAHKEYSKDGMHLSKKGYDVWMDSLKAHLK